MNMVVRIDGNLLDAGLDPAQAAAFCGGLERVLVAASAAGQVAESDHRPDTPAAEAFGDGGGI